MLLARGRGISGTRQRHAVWQGVGVIDCSYLGQLRKNADSIADILGGMDRDEAAR